MLYEKKYLIYNSLFSCQRVGYQLMFVAIKFQNLIIKKPYYKLRYTIWNFAANATKPILSILKVHQFYKVTLKTLYNDRLAFNFANPSFFMDYLFDVTPCLLAYFP